MSLGIIIIITIGVSISSVIYRPHFLVVFFKFVVVWVFVVFPCFAFVEFVVPPSRLPK